LYNYSKGLVLYNLGKYSEAIESFEIAIQNNPNYSSAKTAKEQSENKLKFKDNLSENVMMTEFNKNLNSLSKESSKTVELTSINYIHNESSNGLESNFNYEPIVVAHKSFKANPFHKDGNREPSTQHINLEEIVLQSADKKSLKTLDTISSDDKKKLFHQMMFEYLLKYKENKIDIRDIKFVKEGENNKIVGMGTFGIVYLGKINQVEYAVKFLNPKNEKEVEFLKNELDNLFNLKHPHLSSIYFWTYDSQGFYFVIEYYRKGDLFNYIKEHKGEISLDKKIDFFIQIASALDYLHKMNKQHNDIKSSNVFVADRDKVVLGDFGFTKTLTYSVLAQPMSLKGSPYWIAPEVFEESNPSLKSDIYSFSIFMWEVITEELPKIEYKSLEALISKVSKGERPSLDKLRNVSHIREELIQFIEKCWRHNPEERPSSAEINFELNEIRKLF
jgi:tRNA A-37 threonylcarbamoyl transferase component Bud32